MEKKLIKENFIEIFYKINDSKSQYNLAITCKTLYKIYQTIKLYLFKKFFHYCRRKINMKFNDYNIDTSDDLIVLSRFENEEFGIAPNLYNFSGFWRSYTSDNEPTKLESLISRKNVKWIHTGCNQDCPSIQFGVRRINNFNEISFTNCLYIYFKNEPIDKLTLDSIQSIYVDVKTNIYTVVPKIPTNLYYYDDLTEQQKELTKKYVNLYKNYYDRFLFHSLIPEFVKQVYLKAIDIILKHGIPDIHNSIFYTNT